MARLKIDVINKADRKLMRAEKQIFSQSERTAQDIAKLGKLYARSIAPRDSGYLIRLIKLMKGKDKLSYEVVSQNPKGNRLWPNTGRYPDFNLVQWMHQTGGVFKTNNPFGRAGTKHIRTGDPRYMYTTLRYLKSIAGVKARKDFSKIKIR